MRSFWRIAFFLAATAVLTLSLLPSSALPPIDTGWDKSDHVLGFVVLALLGLAGWPDRSLILLAGLVAFGALIEVLQGFTGYRIADWRDLLADGIGVLAGLALWPLLRRLHVAWSAAQAARQPAARRSEAQTTPRTETGASTTTLSRSSDRPVVDSRR